MAGPRTKARHLAAQAMYQYIISPIEATDLISQFKSYKTWNKLDEELFSTLVKGSFDSIPGIDTALAQVIDRDIDKIDPIELSLLRLGAYELMHSFEVPYKVILNEYINLAKVFGSVKSDSYVNATLDKLAKSVRSTEILNG